VNGAADMGLHLACAVVGGGSGRMPSFTRGFHWVLLLSLKTVRFDRSAASIFCPL